MILTEFEFHFVYNVDSNILMHVISVATSVYSRRDQCDHSSAVVEPSAVRSLAPP
jgi:hypothetical protein